MNKRTIAVNLRRWYRQHPDELTWLRQHLLTNSLDATLARLHAYRKAVAELPYPTKEEQALGRWLNDEAVDLVWLYDLLHEE